MKRMTAVLLLMLFFISPIIVFAESYEFNNAEISIDVDESEWIVITSDNYQEKKEALGELYGEVEKILTTGNSLVAISTDKDYYWTFGYSSQDQNVDFSGESDETIMSIYDEDLTNGDATASDIKASIYETNGYKYLVGDTIISQEDFTTGAVQYMTGVGKSFYVFVAYSYDGKRLTDDQKKEIESLLDGVSYKLEPATEPVSGENGFWALFGKRALITFLTITAIVIIRYIWSSIKNRDKDILEAAKKVEEQMKDDGNANLAVAETECKESEDIFPDESIKEAKIESADDTNVIEEETENEITEESIPIEVMDATEEEPKTEVIVGNGVIEDDDELDAAFFESEEEIEPELRPESEKENAQGVQYEGYEKSKSNDNIPEKQLRQLKDLYDAGILTEEEFREKKKKLLNI